MITVGISEFRASMNTILHRVNQGEIVTLTSRGAEVAKLVPRSCQPGLTKTRLIV